MSSTNINLRRRGKIARDVFQVAYDDTDSFEAIGTDLAYLMGAILYGDRVDWRDGEATELLAILRDNFEADHPVWNYVHED